MSYKVAIASGKGGTGKTTVAVNLYRYIIDHIEPDTLLVDCDVEEPDDALFFANSRNAGKQNVDQLIPEIDINQCTFCRKCVEYCEFNAITVIPPAQFAEVNSDLCHSCGACVYACPENAITEKPFSIGSINRYQLDRGPGLTEGELKIGSAMQTPVIRELKKKTEDTATLIFYDAPPGTSCPVVSTLADVDYVVLVTEPTPFGFHDLKLTIDLVQEMRLPHGVVINKSGLGDRQVYDYLEEKEIPLLGEIPFSRDVAERYSQSESMLESIAGYKHHFQQIADIIQKQMQG